MKNKRWLVFIPLSIVVISILVGSFIYRRRDGSEPPLTIKLLEYPHYVTVPTIVLRGNVSQKARVEVTRDSSSIGPVFSSGNYFHIEVKLEPGDNYIRFSARTDEGDSAQTQTLAKVTWEPKNPPIPTINPLPTTTNLPLVTITGTTYPDGLIRITVSPDLPDVARNPEAQRTEAKPQVRIGSEANMEKASAQVMEPVTNEVTAAKDGSFQLKVPLPVAGPYKVTAAAYNSTGASTAASSDVRFVYDPDWYPSLSPAELATAKRLIRKANIVLAHKQMTVTLEVTLPRDDPMVTSLLSDGTKLDEFLDNIFGLQINGTHYSGEFDDIVPQIVLKDGNATIRATTASYRTTRDFLPLLHGELTLAGKNNFPFSYPDDSLSIQPNDYTINSISPPPTLFEKNTMTWVGGERRSFDDPDDFGSSGQQIKMQLSYRPFGSPRNLLRLAQVSPNDFWKYPGSTIPQLFYGLLGLVPMLWVLWLLGESPVKSKIDEGLRNDLSRLSKALITLSLVATIFNVCWGLAYLGWYVEPLRDAVEEVLGHINSSSFPGLLALASVGVLLLAGLCQLVAWLLSGRTWSLWFARISKGIRNGALISLLLSAMSLLDVNQWIARTASFLVIAGTLSLFFFRVVNVLKHGTPLPKYRRRLRALAFVVSLVFVAPLSIPAANFSAQSLTAQFFSVLQDLMPYAVVIGLLIILKQVHASAHRQSRLLVLCIGLILFSAYLVGSTPSLFMVPIPFILSIWIFKKLLIHDYSKRAELDSVNSEVVTQRRSLIEKVLAYETAQVFQADVEKLKDKVSSGGMTLKDFEDRKLDIEKYAQAKESASTHVNGLRARNTVLSIGPTPDDWTNGKWCSKWGARLIAPFLAVYLLLLLLRSTTISGSAFGFLFATSQVLSFVADWLIAAFFFGYYFRYIRGDSGLEKGLRTACAVIICLLPAWVTNISSKTDLLGVFFRAGQTFLFFTLMGMVAFDYRTFRNALRDQFRWKTFARFGDMPSFTAVLSVLLTSVGVGLTTVVTGQFKVLLTNLITAAFHQAPGPPP